MKTFGRNSSLQEREKRTLNRLLAYQKEAEKIIRKQPSRHMIRKGSITTARACLKNIVSCSF